MIAMPEETIQQAGKEVTNGTGVGIPEFGYYYLAQRIDRLEAKMDGHRDSLEAKIDDQQNRLAAKIDDQRDKLDAKLENHRSRLEAKIDAQRDYLEGKIENKLDGLRQGVKSEISTLHAEIHENTRTSRNTLAGVIITAVGVVVAVFVALQ